MLANYDFKLAKAPPLDYLNPRSEPTECNTQLAWYSVKAFQLPFQLPFILWANMVSNTGKPLSRYAANLRGIFSSHSDNSGLKIFWSFMLFAVICFGSSASAIADKEDLLGVVVYKSKRIPWSDSIEALGTLRAKETVSLTSPVTDIITKINFEDGQRVEKGFVLVEMTDAEESALVQEMTVRARESKSQINRLKKLPNSGAVSESLYDERDRDYRAAKAQLEAMKSRLADRLIIAPFNGVLGLRNVSAGALIEPGDTITTLTDDSVMKLDFNVPSIFLSSLKVGLPIKAKTTSFRDRVFEGTVSSIDSKVDVSTRAIAVRALIDNADGTLRPGLLMTVYLSYGFRESVVVPEEALIPSGSVQDVFVAIPDNSGAESGKIASVEKRRVEIGSRVAGQVEVLSGLKEGEYVITHGTMSARVGKKVKMAAEQSDGEGIKEVLERVK
jgi:membrane fusion protein (multidrug efflux system)